MKSNFKLIVAVLAGILVGAAGKSAIHGQQVKTPPVYIISEADAIKDATAIKSYGAKVQETLAPFNGCQGRSKRRPLWRSKREPLGA